MLIVSKLSNANGALGHSFSSNPRHMKVGFTRIEMLKLKNKWNTPISSSSSGHSAHILINFLMFSFALFIISFLSFLSSFTLFLNNFPAPKKPILYHWTYEITYNKSKTTWSYSKL